MVPLKSDTALGKIVAAFAIWFGLLGLLVLVSGCDGSAAKPTTADADPKPVRMVKVALESSTQTERYAAVIRPRIEADIGFRVGGKVVQRLVDVGGRVAPGTVLARLDTADLELQVRALRAQLASAKADTTNAKVELERYGQLRQGGWSTQQEWDKRRTTLERSQAKENEIAAQLSVASNAERYAALVADAPGVVTAVLVEPGQVVAQGQPVFKIARDGDVEAVAAIPEQKVAAIGNATISIELWALPGRQIEGRVREISPMADAATRTYQARVTLIDPPPEVKFGMTATLVAAMPEPGRIALLPMTALTQQGTNAAVWVVKPDSGSLELRPVRVAAYAGDRLVVSSGLRDGDMVVTAGVHKLTAADKVRPWTEPSR